MGHAGKCLFRLGPARRRPQLQPTWRPLREPRGEADAWPWPARGSRRPGRPSLLSRGRDKLYGVETRAAGPHRASEPQFPRQQSGQGGGRAGGQ